MAAWWKHRLQKANGDISMQMHVTLSLNKHYRSSKPEISPLCMCVCVWRERERERMPLGSGQGQIAFLWRCKVIFSWYLFMIFGFG